MSVGHRDALALASFFSRASSPVIVCGHDGSDPDSFASAVVAAFLASLFGRAATALFHPARQRWLAALAPHATRLGVDVRPVFSGVDDVDIGDASLVLVDAQSTKRARSQIGDRRVVPDVIIDHHAPEDAEATSLIIVREASSTSEIIASALKAMMDDGALDARQKRETRRRLADVAALLIAGIQSDTQNMSMYVGPETTAMYAWLMNAAAEIVGRDEALRLHRVIVDSLQHRFTVDEYLLTATLLKEVVIDESAKAWAVIAEATDARNIDATYDMLRRMSYQTNIDGIRRYIVVSYNEKEARVGIRADDGVALEAARLIGGGGRAYAAGALVALAGDETPRSVVFRLCSFLRDI